MKKGVQERTGTGTIAAQSAEKLLPYHAHLFSLSPLHTHSLDIHPFLTLSFCQSSMGIDNDDRLDYTFDKVNKSSFLKVGIITCQRSSSRHGICRSREQAWFAKERKQGSLFSFGLECQEWVLYTQTTRSRRLCCCCCGGGSNWATRCDLLASCKLQSMRANRIPYFPVPLEFGAPP